MGFFSKIGTRLNMMQDMFHQTGALSDEGFPAEYASSLRKATQRCMSCSSAEACQKWLDIGNLEDEAGREPPAFCPNQSLQNMMRES